MTALILLAGVTCVHAQDDQKIDRMTVDTMEVFTPDTIKWKDEPILPKGAQSALVVGDPNKSGVFIAYLRFPANYVIPAHTHPFAEVITVLRGNLGNGMGEKFEPQRGEILAAAPASRCPPATPTMTGRRRTRLSSS